MVELVEAGTLSTCLGLACVANASSGAGGGTGKGQACTLSTLSGRKTMGQTLNQPIPDYSMASWMAYMRMLPTSNGFTDHRPISD
jgi:hypothetical protein